MESYSTSNENFFGRGENFVNMLEMTQEKLI